LCLRLEESQPAAPAAPAGVEPDAAATTPSSESKRGCSRAGREQTQDCHTQAVTAEAAEAPPCPGTGRTIPSAGAPALTR
jgi:hypothetical protein